MRFFTLCLILLGATFLSACPSNTIPDEPPIKPQPATPTLPAPPQTIDGHQRLSQEIAIPRSYDLLMEIDPRQEKFSGTVSIDVDIKQTTTFFQMHGGNLEIQSATIDGNPVETQKGTNGGLLIQSPTPIARGAITLEIAYSGALDEVPDSLYRVKDENRWYAFTQFEPLEAREAFPCFDDPGFKTPWKVSLKVPSQMQAIANAPEEDRKVQGEHTLYTFKDTRPLPTYLVAVAVGEFDIVEAPEGTIPGVPLRVIAVKGKGKLAQYALDHTPEILQTLTQFFGSPYPFAKLDLIGVPNFAAGAMENVGLVTFRERFLLVDGDEPPPGDRRSILGIIAHELAHMWYGNLVTMAWWDDLWLNEAFATWMASYVLEKVAPDLEEPLSAVRSRGWVVNLDAKEQARAIRQPILHGGDVYNAFDGITYTKGAAVLRMLENWVGPQAFRKGVRDYMVDHAYGSATTDDLLSAWNKSAGKPVSEVAATFLDQPGTPLIDAEVTCDADKAQVTLRQSRWLPAGSKSAPGTPWRVPVCMRYETKDGQTKRLCTDLEGPEKVQALEACPVWLHPNADERGYYLWRQPAAQTMALIQTHRDKLSLPERTALPSHLSAGLRSEKMSTTTFLNANKALAKEKHWMVLYGVTDNIGTLANTARAQDVQAPYAKMTKKLLGPHLKRIGLKPKKNEPFENSVLRPDLISAMALHGQDKATLRFIDKQARAFLKNPDSVPFETGRQALWIKARTGDEAYWNKIKTAFDNSGDKPAMRSALLKALGNFSEPELVQKSLNLLLDGTLRGQDFWRIAGPPMREEALHNILWTWFTTNYDAIITFLGDKSARRMPGMASGFCNAEGRKTASDFFAGVTQTPGMQRNLDLTLERIDQCQRLREVNGAPLKAYFKKRR